MRPTWTTCPPPLDRPKRQRNAAESNLRFRLGRMVVKDLKLKRGLCALLGFSELELEVGTLKVLDVEVPFFALRHAGGGGCHLRSS